MIQQFEDFTLDQEKKIRKWFDKLPPKVKNIPIEVRQVKTKDWRYGSKAGYFTSVSRDHGPWIGLIDLKKGKWDEDLFLHEVGHAVKRILLTKEQTDLWDNSYKQSWAVSDYMENSPEEQFAENFTAFVIEDLPDNMTRPKKKPAGLIRGWIYE